MKVRWIAGLLMLLCINPDEPKAQGSIDTAHTFTERMRIKGISKNDAKRKAYESVEALRDGLLLVRLKTNAKKLAAYRIAYLRATTDKVRKQMEDLIKSTIKKRDINNREIVKTFKRSFLFCRVAFFIDTSTATLMDGRLKILIVDTTLIPKVTFNPIQEFYLIAEFGLADADSYDSKSIAKNGKGAAKPQPDPNAKGLVVRDPDMIQMPRPFPYFAREEIGFTGKSKERMVIRLNLDLYKLHGKAMNLK